MNDEFQPYKEHEFWYTWGETNETYDELDEQSLEIVHDLIEDWVSTDHNLPEFFAGARFDPDFQFFQYRISTDVALTSHQERELRWRRAMAYFERAMRNAEANPEEWVDIRVIDNPSQEVGMALMEALESGEFTIEQLANIVVPPLTTS
jgi:hypothetical protein